jgi:hypothetical protein
MVKAHCFSSQGIRPVQYPVSTPYLRTDRFLSLDDARDKIESFHSGQAAASVYVGTDLFWHLLWVIFKTAGNIFIWTEQKDHFFLYLCW